MENIIKNVKCKIVRQIYASNNFRTFGCILTDSKDEDKIVLNKYGNFTISGDLPFLNIARGNLSKQWKANLHGCVSSKKSI